MTASVLFAIVVAVQIGDAVSTILCLRHEELAEANPMARGFMQRVGVVWASILLKALAVALALAVLLAPISPVTKIAILASVAALNGWVVIGNFRLLAKARAAKGRCNLRRWLPKIRLGGACQSDCDGDWEGRYVRLIFGPWSMELTATRFDARHCRGGRP